MCLLAALCAFEAAGAQAVLAATKFGPSQAPSPDASSAVWAPRELVWVPSPRAVRMRRTVESEFDSASRRELVSEVPPPAAPQAAPLDSTWLDSDWRSQTLSITAMIVTLAAMLQLYIVYMGGNLVTVDKSMPGMPQAALSLKLGCMLNVISQVALASSPRLTRPQPEPEPEPDPEPEPAP